MTEIVSITGEIVADIVRLNCRCLAECVLERYCLPKAKEDAESTVLNYSVEEMILLFLIEAEFAAQQIVADIAEKTGHDKAAALIRERAKKDYAERMEERAKAATEQTELPA